MHILLCDTTKLDVSKDFAGGFGVGQYPGREEFRDWIIRWFFKRDRRPVALTFAYLAAVFTRLGHRVEYVVDRRLPEADFYIFCPSLITLAIERDMMTRLLAERPSARVLVVGLVPTVLPEAFAGLGVTVVRGEPEQMLWRLDEVLASPGRQIALGQIDDLDRLPPPDWSPFRPERFRIGFDFWRFPTALIQASRGCPFGCDYCPYRVADRRLRLRSAEAVADEMLDGIRRWDFRSFKFRDPCFGADRRQLIELAERIARLPRRVQFSIETRVDLMTPEMLGLLRRAGLTSVTIGIERSDEELARHGRRAIAADRQREFIVECRRLGVRTVGGFLIGLPEDTEESILAVRDYAVQLNPTFANFNVWTPYPGTPQFDQVRQGGIEPDFSRFTVYEPIVPGRHLSTDRVAWLLRKCFRRFYFRWDYLRANGRLLWPRTDRQRMGRD